MTGTKSLNILVRVHKTSALCISWSSLLKIHT